MKTWSLPLRDERSLFFGMWWSRWGSRILVFALLCFILNPPELEAKKLVHRGSKFQVKAPKGFKLKVKKGIYRVFKGRESLTFMRLHSPLDAKATAKSFAKDSKMKRSRIRKQGKATVVTGVLKNKSVYIEFQKKGAYIDATKYTPILRKNKKASKLPATVTRADTTSLRRIANTRRGGSPTPLQVTVPLKRFSQGGASAMVPNIPGWTFSGAVGGLDGGKAQHGNFALGIGIPIMYYVPSDQCITTIWTSLAPGAQVTGISMVPGSAGTLGPDFESAYYNVRYTYQGYTYYAIFLSASNHSLFYFSYIAVEAKAPTGIGPALLETWRTWDPLPAVKQRLNQTVQTILSTPGAGPIDPKVFDERQRAWLEYIKM